MPPNAMTTPALRFGAVQTPCREALDAQRPEWDADRGRTGDQLSQSQGTEAAPERPDLEAEGRALRSELARAREQRDILRHAGHLFGSAAARYERIEAMKDEHSLAACAARGVSRRGYYRWKDAELGVCARADAQLTEVIRAGMASMPRLWHYAGSVGAARLRPPTSVASA